MRAAGAGELSAWMGPAIGPDQFEVGRMCAPPSSAGRARRLQPIAGKPGKYLADIYALALRAAPRRRAQVHGGEFCTVSDPARFYSYRRDGVTGRQASLIWIKCYCPTLRRRALRLPLPAI
jgi:copper oxidase (laccase) domain-containing protein